MMLIFAACGDDAPPSGPEAGPNPGDGGAAVDGSIEGGGPGMDGGGTPGMEGGVPLPMRDGGPSAGETEAYFGAEEDARRAECECSASEWGFGSIEECIDAYEIPSGDLLECHDRAFATHESVLGPHYACVNEVNARYASCLRASGCRPAAISRCEVGSDDGFRACPEFSFDAERAYMETLLMCTGGSMSACPEEMSDLIGTSVFIGSTLRAGDDFQPSCAEFRAPDRAFRWQAPSAGTFVFETAGSGFNTVLTVLSDCGGRELACNDDWADPRSQVEVSLGRGESVIIVVDGYDEGSAGEFVVNIFRG